MPEINYIPFRRQFYIGATAKPMGESWLSYPLPSGLVLSCAPDLPIQFISNAHGHQFVLLGDAVESLDDKPGIAQTLASLTDLEQLQQVYSSWAGRWVLLTANELHLDASGLLGCYYRVENGVVEVASAAGFITGLPKPDTFRLLKAGGAEFYPPPGSGYHGVNKILPSQVLQLPTGEVLFRNLQVPVPALSYAETIAYLASLLCTALKNIYKQSGDKKLVLGLTGGYDSRALMAALEKAKIPFETLTFWHPNIRPSDVSIPRQLAAISGVRHRLIKRHERQPLNRDKYDVHTCGHSVETDRENMLYQQFNELEAQNTILLRGGGFEVGRCAYYPWLPQERIDGAGISAIQKGNSTQGEAWDRWLQWVAETPQIKLDWRDRYYIEQRLAGWLSSTEQGLDLVNIDRMVPANCTLFFNVMLSLPEDIRKTKVQMKDLIRYLSPQLADVPINPPVSYYYKQYRRVLFKVNKLKQKLNWL